MQRPFLLIVCLVFVCLVLGTATAWAAPPKLDYLFPAGAARGQTVAVQAGGTFSQWPVEAWVDRDGVRVEAEQEKGELRVTVDPDAEPGVVYLRLYDEQGASGLRPLLVGMLPELQEAEPNDAPDAAQQVDLPVTVNGRLASSGDVDGFAVALEQGQTLVASLEANFRLASPMDAVLQICTPEGFVLQQNDDARGLDPLIIFRAPADGTYVVRTFAFPETPNSSIAFAGGEAFVYRLTLTTGGLADHALPMALERGRPAGVQLIGWNLTEQAGALSIEPGPDAGWVDVFDPQVARALRLPVCDHPSLVHVGADEDSGPRPIELPVTLTGRLDESGQTDRYRFQATKGQKLAFRVESRALGYPLDAVLRLTDGQGQRLAEVDDVSGQPDPQLTWTAPADGPYHLELRDLHGHAGLRYVYRLTAAEAVADYLLRLESDALVLEPGKPLEVAVSIERREGFAGEIEIQADGLPAGVTAAPVTSPAEGDAAKSVTLLLTAGPDAASGPFRITGTAAGEPPLARTAHFTVPGHQATHQQLWLTVATGDQD